jgi:hypothetical protein
MKQNLKNLKKTLSKAQRVIHTLSKRQSTEKKRKRAKKIPKKKGENPSKAYIS